jgi:hypothetical protein
MHINSRSKKAMVTEKPRMAMGGLSEDDKRRFDVVRERAKTLGVLDINFGGGGSSDALECYERTLDLIEDNKEILDQNAGEDGL